MIRINNKSYSGGKNISIMNNKIFIDGIEITDKEVVDAKNILFEISGDVETLEVDHADKVMIAGNVTGNVKTMSGSVTVEGDVHGKVNTMSGNVQCGNVSGKVETMSGNIRTK